MNDVATRWTIDPAGSGHPVLVAQAEDGSWQTNTGQRVHASRTHATPAGCFARPKNAKKTNFKRRRVTPTRAAVTAEKEE